MMSQEMLDFLRHIVALDGIVDPADEKAIEEIERIFKAANRSSVRRRLQDSWSMVKNRSARLLSRRKS